MSEAKELKDMTDEELHEAFDKKFGRIYLSELNEKDVGDPIVVELASRVARGRA